jgi:hypothetical protein
MHDTQGAGVVTETNNSIVVAQKPPRCSINPTTKKLFGESPVKKSLDITIYIN